MMYSINKDYQKVKKEDIHGKVNYYETSSYVFIGPYVNDIEDPCFNCFKEAVKANGSRYYWCIEQERTELTSFNLFADDDKCTEELRGAVLIFNKNTGSIEKKEIYKNAFCENCSSDFFENKILKDNHNEKLNKEGRVVSFTNVINKLKKHEKLLIDQDTGIGRMLFRDAESDVIPMYGIEAYIGQRQYHSYGRAESLSASKYSAILEMIERHASMIPQFTKPLRASYHQLKQKKMDVINPESFILHKSVEGEHLYSHDKEIYWTACRRLDNNKEVLIPEQLIYFDNQIIRGENRFIYETSNGAALGNSMKEAVMYGLFEVIERDCFLVHWYCKKTPKRIDVSSSNNLQIKFVLKQLDDLGYDVHLFDITLETDIPAVWVLAVNRKDGANLKYYNAAGAHYNPEKAIFSGLVEVATSALIYEKKLDKEKSHLNYLIQNPSGVKKMEDHVNYYSFEENGKAFDFLLNNLEQMELIEVHKMIPAFPFTYDALKRAVLDKHPDIYIADLTQYLTEKLDFHAVKILIPSLQPMTFGLQNERLNLERLNQYCEDLSLLKNKEREPHPFP